MIHLKKIRHHSEYYFIFLVNFATGNITVSRHITALLCGTKAFCIKFIVHINFLKEKFLNEKFFFNIFQRIRLVGNSYVTDSNFIYNKI